MVPSERKRAAEERAAPQVERAPPVPPPSVVSRPRAMPPQATRPRMAPRAERRPMSEARGPRTAASHSFVPSQCSWSTAPAADGQPPWAPPSAWAMAPSLRRQRAWLAPATSPVGSGSASRPPPRASVEAASSRPGADRIAKPASVCRASTAAVVRTPSPTRLPPLRADRLRALPDPRSRCPRSERGLGSSSAPECRRQSALRRERARAEYEPGCGAAPWMDPYFRRGQGVGRRTWNPNARAKIANARRTDNRFTTPCRRRLAAVSTGAREGRGWRRSRNRSPSCRCRRGYR